MRLARFVRTVLASHGFPAWARRRGGWSRRRRPFRGLWRAVPGCRTPYVHGMATPAVVHCTAREALAAAYPGGGRATSTPYLHIQLLCITPQGSSRAWCCVAAGQDPSVPVPMPGGRSRELPLGACHIRIRARHRFGDSQPGGLPRIDTRLTGRCPETRPSQWGGRAGHGSVPFLRGYLEAVKQAGDWGRASAVVEASIKPTRYRSTCEWGACCRDLDIRPAAVQGHPSNGVSQRDEEVASSAAPSTSLRGSVGSAPMTGLGRHDTNTHLSRLPGPVDVDASIVSGRLRSEDGRAPSPSPLPGNQG